MLHRRKQLVKRIAVRLVIAAVLTAAVIPVLSGVRHRMQNREIARRLGTQYTNLQYDRELGHIAEHFAKLCYDNDLADANTLNVRAYEPLINRASTQSIVIKFTFQADSDDAFLNSFQEHVNSDSRIGEAFGKCEYIGIGRYKGQVFLLAFYKE